MILSHFASVLFQFFSPKRAYDSLMGEGQGAALAGSASLILIVGFVPFLFTGSISGINVEIPLLIALERVLLSAAAGVAVYTLSYALGNRKPLWPAMSSCFLSMGAFMIMIALLTLMSHLLSLPLQFTWSPAEFLFDLPGSRLSLFLILFAAKLDLASLATIFLWGKGLSEVWNVDSGTGQRLAWTVYLFGILLLTLPVFIAAPGGEGPS